MTYGRGDTVETNKSATCFFTGHRTIAKVGVDRLTCELDRAIDDLIARGYDSFVCGGAVGFDTVAACRVAVAKKRHPHIRLVLVLPCRDQTMKWRSTYDISLYQRLKGLADQIIYSAESYTAGCMHLRNRTMADMSSACVAYYNNSGVGGTAYTVKYATEAGVDVINLYDLIKT